MQTHTTSHQNQTLANKSTLILNGTFESISFNLKVLKYIRPKTVHNIKLYYICNLYLDFGLLLCKHWNLCRNSNSVCWTQFLNEMDLFKHALIPHIIITAFCKYEFHNFPNPWSSMQIHIKRQIENILNDWIFCLFCVILNGNYFL